MYLAAAWYLELACLLPLSFFLLDFFYLFSPIFWFIRAETCKLQCLTLFNIDFISQRFSDPHLEIIWLEGNYAPQWLKCPIRSKFKFVVEIWFHSTGEQWTRRWVCKSVIGHPLKPSKRLHIPEVGYFSECWVHGSQTHAPISDQFCHTFFRLVLQICSLLSKYILKIFATHALTKG